MMRSQASNSAQSSGQNEIQKKSVFDRLGHQLDNGRAMKRRPSPGQYGDYGPPPPMHEPDYGRYGGRDGRSQAEIEWRYQNDRRMMPPFPGRERHLPPPPPMQHPHPQQTTHYEMEMSSRQPPPYYPHPNSYHAGPQGGMPPPMAPPGGLPMPMHQQRSSPKYDRMPNLGPSFKHRRMTPMEHCISPSRSFLPPGPAQPSHLGPHEIPQLQPDGGAMFPQSYRWTENVESEYMMNQGSRMMEEQFDPASRRHNRQQQSNQSMNSQLHNNNSSLTSEAPRYARWRERRDVITNLDRETARSSYRTDSLKSSLQQSDSKNHLKKSSRKNKKADEIQTQNQSSPSAPKKDSGQAKTVSDSKDQAESGSATGNKKDCSAKVANQKVKSDPQDISDGEIIDDEDSSDDEEQQTKGENVTDRASNHNYHASSIRIRDMYEGTNIESQHFYENGKKRRLIEREDYAMDYETISDEDLDDFMEEKKIIDGDDSGNPNRDKNANNHSEIELLNALGLDWANLVEIAKQSKAPSKETSSLSPRFSLANYLPTLGITADLAGPELYELVMKTCRINHDHYQ